MFIYIILLIGSAWLLQSFLGFFQIKNFNKHFSQLRRKGRVAIGRKKGFFRAGTVILIAINKSNQILEAKKMQGVTVFSRVKPLRGLDGKNLLKLTMQDLHIYDKLTVAAIQDAATNLKIISKGGEVPIQKSLFERLVQKTEVKRGVN
ncbi:transcriptional regulator GutM [Caldalkalibacillus mannanilyticus]|uniref:transcriptional regulator GutM n=1 Tax=Caldalkalibacillus mannanilyticus TaxID=1418 RepID=UPI00046AC1EA|nr:transcriptional regulator GutM [Caldalkalibacillus mannanilyticus]